MPHQNPPPPRSFGVHVFWVAVLCAMLFALIGLTVFLTDGRDIGNFTRTDWQIFGAFLFAGALDLIAAFYIAGRCRQCLAEQRRQVFLAHLHEGIDPADCACVLPGCGDDRRALIRQDGDGYLVSVDVYDDASATWQPESPAYRADTRGDILHFLQDECNFYVEPEDVDSLPDKAE